MMIDLSDKVAVVTGGASGIGRGICLVLAEQGADVAVTDMNLAGSQSVADDVAATGRQSVAIQVDVTDRASIQDMVSQVLQRFGTIDILVNDAGIVGVGEWWERERPSDDDWSQVFAVNVRGQLLACFCPHPRWLPPESRVKTPLTVARRLLSFDLSTSSF